MYRVERINKDIAPTRNPAIHSLASLWNLVAPGVREELSWIQVDGKYIVSLGAHFTHQYTLLSKVHPIPYPLAHEICAYLSFLLDTPITPNIGVKAPDYKKDLRGIRRVLRLRGEVFATTSTSSEFSQNSTSSSRRRAGNSLTTSPSSQRTMATYSRSTYPRTNTSLMRSSRTSKRSLASTQLDRS